MYLSLLLAENLKKKGIPIRKNLDSLMLGTLSAAMQHSIGEEENIFIKQCVKVEAAEKQLQEIAQMITEEFKSIDKVFAEWNAFLKTKEGLALEDHPLAQQNISELQWQKEMLDRQIKDLEGKIKSLSADMAIVCVEDKVEIKTTTETKNLYREECLRNENTLKRLIEEETSSRAEYLTVEEEIIKLKMAVRDLNEKIELKKKENETLKIAEEETMRRIQIEEETEKATLHSLKDDLALVESEIKAKSEVFRELELREKELKLEEDVLNEQDEEEKAITDQMIEINNNLKAELNSLNQKLLEAEKEAQLISYGVESAEKAGRLKTVTSIAVLKEKERRIELIKKQYEQEKETMVSQSQEELVKLNDERRVLEEELELLRINHRRKLHEKTMLEYELNLINSDKKDYEEKEKFVLECNAELEILKSEKEKVLMDIASNNGQYNILKINIETKIKKVQTFTCIFPISPQESIRLATLTVLPQISYCGF